MLKITGIKGLFQCLLIGMLGLALGACDDVSSWGGGASSSSSSFGSASSVRYTISGSVTNITGTLNLYNNNVLVATVTPTTGSNTANYSFSVPQGASYALSVGSYTFAGTTKNLLIPGDPPGEVCVLAGAQTAGPSTGKVIPPTGTGLTANLTVDVTCTSFLKIQGKLSGLRSGKSVTLQNTSGGVTVVGTPITSNTSTIPVGTVDTLFTATSGAYSISVNTQPVGQNCTVAGGVGNQQIADVTNVVITCADSFYAVGGTVGGLSGTVGLRLNGGTPFPVSANGSFAFPVAQKLVTGSSFIVDVATQPSAQTCTILNATGQVVGSDVTTVAVSCVTNTYNVGGAVSGLGAGKSVVLNITGTGSQSVTVSGNGVFTFPTKLPAGSYTASIPTQPVGQNCSLTGGAITVAAADISPVVVSCQTLGFNVGGTVSGLSGGGSVILLNNNANPVTISANGPATYYSSVQSGAGYSVTVGTQPTNLFCSVSNGVNTVTGSDVTNVNVSCSSTSYTISGTVSNLTAGSVTLTNNGGDDTTRSSNGQFTFPASVQGGGSYNVAVKTQPAGQVCTVNGGNDTNLQANVAPTSIIVDCANGAVSGTITGLTNSGLQISLNGSESLSPASGATNFAFTTVLANSSSGTAYNVTVTQSPVGLTCLPINGAGPVAGNVTGIVISCAPTTYTIGGTVTGLAPGATVRLVNGTDPTQVTPTTTNGSFTFVTAKLPGDAYTVTVATGGQPAGYSCLVTNGTGTVDVVTPVNVTTITVDCSTVASYSIGGTMTGVPVGIGQASYMKLNLAIDGASAGDFPVVYGSGNPVTGTGSFTFGTPALWSSSGGATTAGTGTLSVSNNSLIVLSSTGTVIAAGTTSVTGARLYLVNFGGAVPCTLVNAPTGVTVGTPETIANTVTGTVCATNITMTYVGTYTGITSATYAPLTFATGKAYAVTVATQPSHGTCAVTNGSGTLSNVNITAYNATTNPTGILVNCSYSESLISGVVTGYNIPTTSAVITISGTDVNDRDQTEDTAPIGLTGQGSFTFTSTKYYKAGSAYTAVIKTQPGGNTVARSCDLQNGSGTVPSGVNSVLNVSNLILSCHITDMLNTAAFVSTSGSGGTGVVMPVTFNTSGVPTATGTATAAALYTPTQVFVTPYNGLYAYVIDGDVNTTNNVRLLTWSDKSAPTLAATGTTVPGAYAIAVNPTNGMTAVVTSTTTNKVYVYAASQTTGVLTLSTAATLTSGTATVGTAPRGIAYHPSGKYIYVVNSGSNTVGAYTSASSQPTFAVLNTLNLTTNTVATGATPYNIAFDASGKYAYVTNSGDGSVSQYKVCQFTSSTATLPCTAGTLSPLTPASVTVEASNVPVQQIVADNTSVYVLATSGKVYQFTIGADGTLTPNTIPFVTSGTGTVGLALGATSSNLYTIDSTQLLYNTLSGSPSALGGAFTGFSTTQSPGVAVGTIR